MPPLLLPGSVDAVSGIRDRQTPPLPLRMQISGVTTVSQCRDTVKPPIANYGRYSMTCAAAMFVGYVLLLHVRVGGQSDFGR